MKKLAIVLLALCMTVPVFGSEVLPYSPTDKADVADLTAEMAAKYQWLTSFEGRDKAAPMDVQVPLTEIAALKSHQPTGGPLWVGVHGAVGFELDPSKAAFTYSDGMMVWNGSFRSAGATGVRLHLDKVNLPKGGAVYVYDDFGQAFGPYTANADKAIWTNTVMGDTIHLQVHTPMGLRGAADKVLFEVAELVHMGDRYSFGTQSADKAFCPWNDSCIINGECQNTPNGLEEGVAYLIFSAQGGSFICTGGLLNNTDNDGTPYLLTANHCFSSSGSASSLEAYFQWTVPCGNSCGSQFNPPGSVPRTTGSTILATSSNTDFTLVQLSQAAPAGSTFLGWTTSPVANSSGTNLFRLSHPAGSPQAYSEHSVNTSAGTCNTLPRGNFIYSDATLADTEGGSSGSPVVNSSVQVVGQLFGACGATPSTTCDNDDRTVDGAFAVTFNSVSQWLDPSGGPTCAPKGASCTSNSDCCSNKCKGRSGNKTCK